MEIVLDYCPFDYQLKVHDDPSRFKSLAGGRRVGKSEYAIQELIRHATTVPGGLSWYVAPTYKDCKEIGWTKFMHHREALRPIIRSVNASELMIVWKNRHRTYFKGSENRTSLRGRGLTLAIMDEAAFQHPEVWNTIIRPALMDREGEAILLSTPNGRNWYYSLHHEDTAFFAYVWPTLINPIISEIELESIKNSLSMRDYKQEILAEFVTQAGMVYDEFTEDNIIPLSTLPYKDVALGVDFGYANATAIGFFDYDKPTDMITLFDEIYVERTTITAIIQLIEDKLHAHNIPKNTLIVYTDPAGNAEELSSGESPVDSMRKAGFDVRNRGSNIAPGISLVRAYICNANGKRRFKVVDTCKQAIKSLRGYTYKTPTANTQVIDEEPHKDGKHDHFCDGIRYYFVNKFDRAKYVAVSPTIVGYNESSILQPRLQRCSKCRRSFLATDRTLHICKACNEDPKKP